MGRKQDIEWLIEMSGLLGECIRRYDEHPTRTHLLESAWLAGRGVVAKMDLMLKPKRTASEAANAARSQTAI